jgi:hypothetical protein
MAGRDSANKQARKATAARRLLGGMGAGVGVFIAAAAMATGSAFTAAPAKADFEDLLDPIIQPLLTSFTESISAFDPAAAVDITSWTDSLLSSLNSFDLAVPTAESAAAVGAAADPTTGTYDLPLNLFEGTEAAVNASINGGSSVPLLVDTGSAGLVVPESDLGVSNLFQLFLQDGLPSSFGSSGYSGGVDYIYLTYNNIDVDYLGGTGLETTGPVDVEVYSWDPSNFGSLFTNNAFETFLGQNDVNGILGVGENASGPTTSPFESFGNVTVDVPGRELTIGGDPGTGTATLSGAPISTDYISIDGGALQAVSNDIDSGGVTGTIPSSLLTSSEYNSSTDLVNPGTTIAVYADKAGTNELYSYTVSADNDPFVVSGSTMDSGAEPFLLGPISMEYTPAGTGTTIFGY